MEADSFCCRLVILQFLVFPPTLFAFFMFKSPLDLNTVCRIQFCLCRNTVLTLTDRVFWVLTLNCLFLFCCHVFPTLKFLKFQSRFERLDNGEICGYCSVAKGKEKRYLRANDY